MSPPIPKDWWLAAALTGAALPSALAQQPADSRQTGVVTSVTQGATRGSSSTPIYIEKTSGQRLVTGPNQTIHVLFSDQSALTVGPNSEVKIAEYKYDAQTKDGNILFEAAKGVFRVVGGLLSKKRDTLVRTTTATIGIRGGITMVDSQPNRTSGIFLFGQSMRMTDNNGNTETITRPGFGSTIDGKNGISTPRRIPLGELSQTLAALEGGQTPPPVQTGGPVPENLEVRNMDSERVGTPSGLNGGLVGSAQTPPTLQDVLGTQSAGNQS